MFSTVLFLGCKKDPQINPPVAQPVVVSAPIKITYSIYPNPCNGDFTIETNTTATQNVSIINLLGAVQLEKPMNGTTHIEDSSLTNGIYYVKITNSTDTVVRKLIVIH